MSHEKYFLGPSYPITSTYRELCKTHIVLAESVRKKVDFLQDTLAQLALPGLDLYGQAVDPGLTRPVAGIITRAVEPMVDTLRRVENSLKVGGLAIFMKGPSVDEEKPAVARSIC